jgi:hypothetical protein
MLVILIVSLLIGAIGVGVWSLAHVRLVSARRRARLERAETVARSAVLVAAGWLEAGDRRVLLDPPTLASLDRERRRPDPDGDGEGDLWSDSDPPHDVRFKDGALTSDGVFGAPDGPDSRDRFLGTPDGPDVEIEDAPGAGQDYLARLSRLIDPYGLVHVRRIRFFRPPATAPGSALATVEARCGTRLPGGVPLTVRARGEVHRISWGRPGRPVLVEGTATFSGDARWEWGEAVIGGDLHAPEATWRHWPSGVPWAAADRPMRRDNDGDGTADDRDGDAVADWEAWRDVGEPVPDPWWRARVGGVWPDVSSAPASCGPAFPFGPWADPPQEPVKDGERSGVRLACPPTAPIEPFPTEWRALARRGPRGIARYVEDPDQEGWVLLNGRGEAQPVEDVVPTDGGVVWLELAPGRSDPLQQTFSASQGGLLVSGGDLVVTGGTRRERSRVRPTDLTDPPEDPGGAYLRTTMSDMAGRAWTTEDWFEADDGPGRLGPDEIGTEPVHFHGLLAVDGGLTITGDYRHAGVVRARRLTGDAEAEQIVVWAACAPKTTARWGPPGAPRVRVGNLRVVR